MKKRPFYKAIEGYWDRFFILLLILLATSLIHVSSYETTDPQERVHTAAPEQVTETGRAAINLSINDGKFRIRDLNTGNLVVDKHEGSEVFDLPAGKYQVEFEDIFGYEKPSKSVFTLEPKQDLTVNCNYKSNQSPQLMIKVYPKEGQYRIFDESGKAVSQATGERGFSFPPGNYRILFLPIDGYRSPGADTFTLQRGITTTVNGVYKTD